MLQAPENRIALPEDMTLELDNLKFLEILKNIVRDEYRNQNRDQSDLIVMDAMKTGHLTSFYTPDRIVTPARVMTNGHLRSVWFKQAEYLGLEEPAVLNFHFGRPPNEDAEPFLAEQDKEVWETLENLNLQPYLWTCSGKLTIFAARPGTLGFLPHDITGEEQESLSGLAFKPGADPGKVAKRLRVNSGAPGVFFHPEPSHFPNLRLGEGMNYRVKVRDSGTVGDGGGCCPRSVANQLLRASGAPRWGDIIAFQIVILAADYSFKGLINIIPDELWQDWSVDLIIDAESVNHQVHSTKFTVGKLMPTRHKPNKRYFYVEPLNHGEIVGAFTDAAELAEQVGVIAERADGERWQRVIEAWLDEDRSLTEEDLEHLHPHGEEVEQTHIQETTQRDEEEKNGLMLAYEASGKSPFALTCVANMLTEGLANTWESHLSRSRRKAYDRDEPNAKPTMSGIMISGENLLLMDPRYAGATYPRRGYLRLIWHPRKEDQLIGVGLSRKDTLEFREALDGMDVDGDKVQFIPFTGENGLPMAQILRLPSSPYGGARFRLNLKDAARLRELGYHFHRLTGEGKYPDLYRRVDGEQVYPDVLHAKPHETPPVWTTNPREMVRRTAELNQYHGYMGKVFLAIQNLCYADRYDPKFHKFNISEEVIDPSLNGSKNPEQVYLPLQEANVRLIEQGHPVDGCIFPRIKPGVRELFEQRNKGKKFEPVVTCKHHHQTWRQAQEAANADLRKRSRTRALMAHGPASRLTEQLPAELYEIATAALEARTEAWANKAGEEREVWALEDLERNQKEARIAALIHEAKEAERSIILEAHGMAQQSVPDLEPGQFIAAWVQCSVSRAKRFQRREVDAIRTNALVKLPAAEIRGFLNERSEPTAVIRAEEPDLIQVGEECYVEECSKSRCAPQGSRKGYPHYHLSNDDEIITNLRPEARSYVGLKLRAAGEVPVISAGEWEQADPQSVFVVINPGEA